MIDRVNLLHLNLFQYQKFAWNLLLILSCTPDTVTAIQNSVTDMINLILNRNSDFTTVPAAINSVANLTGSEMLRNLGKRTELTTVQIYDQLVVLLKNYMDQAPDDQSRWGNVWYT